MYISIRSWNWGLEPSSVEYEALFPQAWTRYDQPLPHLFVTSKQVSPIIPNNYTDTSLPTCVFEFTITNNHPKEKDIEVSLMFTFQNGLSPLFLKI